MKQYFFLTVLGSIAIGSVLFSSVVVAQTPPPKEQIQQAVLVADVSLENAALISQNDATVELSFTLTNGAIQQTGVRYGVTLIAQKGDTQIVVDEKVYDETLTLNEHSSTPVTLSYTAPSQITGAYDIYITSKNSNGFPFGITKVGEVLLAATTTGISIATDTCYTHIATDPQSSTNRLLSSPVLDGDTILELICTATNLSETSVTVVPTVETRNVGAYGAVVGTQGGDMTPIVFGANETKTITVVLPKATKPQMYVANVSLAGIGVASNTVTAHYYIPGSSALIANANLNKDFYVKDDTATVSILWGGNKKEVQGVITLKNSTGRLCSEKVEQTLTIDPVAMMTLVDIPIIRDCYGPQLAVTFKDVDGTVLDTQEYEFATTSVPKPAIGWQTAALIIAGVLAFGIGSLYVRSRMHTASQETEL